MRPIVHRQSKFIIPWLVTWILLTPIAPSQGKPGVLNAIWSGCDTEPIDEKIFVHTDKPFYLTGETLWFAGYCIRPSTGGFSELSKILYVELFNQDNEAVAQLKVPLHSGMARGQIALPTNLVSGLYLLRAYTAWMINSDPDHYYQQTLYILNPLTGLESDNSSIIVDDQMNVNETDAGNLAAEPEITIRLSGQEETYSTSQPVTMELVPGNQTPGILSVSVYPYHPLLENRSGIARWHQTLPDPQINPVKNGIYYPEATGHIVYGRYLGEKKETDDVLVSVGGNNSRIYQVVKQDSGKFVMQLPLNLEYDHLYFWSGQGGKPEISLQSSYDTRLPGLPKHSLRLDSSAIEFVERQSVNMQISNLYSTYNKIHGELQTSDAPDRTFYGQPDFQYHLDNYTRFPSLEEVFREYIRYVALRRRDGKIDFFVWDFFENHQTLANNVFFDQPALVMLDGIPVYDMDWLLQIDPLKIETVDVVATRYFLGNQVFHGIVNLKSYNQEFLFTELPVELSRIAYTGLNNSLSFHNPQHPSQDRIPDSRNTLFWNPRLELGSESTQIRFYTGNTPGKFKIEIRGFTVNGQPVYAAEFINVVKAKNP